MSEQPTSPIDAKHQAIRDSLDKLFNPWSEHRPKEELESIAEYLSFIAESLQPTNFICTASADLLLKFESICLLLKKYASELSQPLADEMSDLIRAENVLATIALLGNVDPVELWRFKRREVEIRFIRLFSLGLIKLNEKAMAISKDKLLSTKIAINRLAEQTRYASTLTLPDYDIGTEFTQSHFDTNLIDLNKLKSILLQLKLACDKLPKGAERYTLESQIDKLTEDLNKERPRWGRLIVKAFVLLAIASDLKTVVPDQYEEITHLASELVNHIHNGGLVETKKRLPQYPNNIPFGLPASVPPSTLRLPWRRDKDDSEEAGDPFQG
jgi:hypothetical protein